MLEIQKFLLSNPLEALEQFAIKTVRHKRYPNLILFKYDQLESPFKERIVQECRGIIIDEADNWKVISRGFDKFFNHGEHLAAPIDWKNAVIMEKLDGSYTCLYFYRGHWHVQTSGTPDASGEVNGLGITFAELFWAVFQEKGYKVPTSEDEMSSMNFVFELMTKYNQVIVRHKKNDLKLIGARDLQFDIEFHIWDEAIKRTLKEWFNWETVLTFPLLSLQEIEDTFPAMDPFSQEGYVVASPGKERINRIKIKNPKYVVIHHLKEGNSLGRLVEIAQNGEAGEFLSYFPEWEEDYKLVKNKIEEFISSLEETYEAIKHIEVQKEFALQAVKTYSPALFEVRKGRYPSIRAYVNKMTSDKLIEILGLKLRGRATLNEKADS